MDDPALANALGRAERALDRIERTAATLRTGQDRDHRLRAKVRGVVDELDAMIRAAGSR